MEKLALTVEEATKLVGIGRTKGYELCASGAWPTIHIGRSVRVPVDGLKTWMVNQTRRATETRLPLSLTEWDRFIRYLTLIREAMTDTGAEEILDNTESDADE